MSVLEFPSLVYVSMRWMATTFCNKQVQKKDNYRSVGALYIIGECSYLFYKYQGTIINVTLKCVCFVYYI